MFKKFRIVILLFILATVGLSTWHAKTKVTEWKSTVHIAVFPINADGSDAAQRYIQNLEKENFEPIEGFIEAEAQRYAVNVMRPVSVTLGPTMQSKPPSLPPRASALDAIQWSLKIRWWAWQNTPKTSVRPDVRMYLLYYDPATYDRLPHSVGLDKGQLGVAHLFASRRMSGSNAVVLTHEILHTFGATDKYEQGSNLPRFPDGYAEPDKKPLYPQDQAEIMGGRVPLSASEARVPINLPETVIGEQTATEIGWRGK